MSSRNQDLTPEERAQAPALNRAMREGAARIADGEPVAGVLADLQAQVLSAGFRAIDYADVRKALIEINFHGWLAAEVAGGDLDYLKGVSAQMDTAFGL
jgi:pantothenate synthetase